jgi:hypothetical protein
MKCEICGEPTRRSRNRFCSRKCKGVARSNLVPSVTCPVCGDSFKPKNQGGGRIQKTCSWECGAALQRTGQIGFCIECGEKIYIRPHRDKEKKFCSVKCANKSMTAEKVAFTCAHCGKEIFRTPFHKKYRDDQNKFCNSECRKAHFIGCNAPNWNGGKCSQNYLGRRTNAYKAWRDSVFARDDYTCQRCGKRSGYLHAHHIIAFADNEAVRTDINNGTTYCVSCHKAVHGWKQANRKEVQSG